MIVQAFDEAGTNLSAFGQRGDRVDQVQRMDALHVDARGLVYVVDSRMETWSYLVKTRNRRPRPQTPL